MSLPEVLLWRSLHERPGGFKCRRQYPLGRHVIDFAGLKARLAIEIDGAAHDRAGRPEHDEQRNSAVTGAGFTIIRIAATDVLADPVSVTEAVVARCTTVEPLHHPPRTGEDRS